MYVRLKLKIKKPTLCCCFTWIVFIELNFTVAFLLIRKTWDEQFAPKVGRWGILRNGGILVMREWFWNGGLVPLYGQWGETKILKRKAASCIKGWVPFKEGGGAGWNPLTNYDIFHDWKSSFTDINWYWPIYLNYKEYQIILVNTGLYWLYQLILVYSIFYLS